MAKPDLFGAGTSVYDTQSVYTTSGLQPGTVGFVGGRSFVWCSHTGSTSLVRGEPLVSAELDYTTQSNDLTTGGLSVGQTSITDITASATAIAAGAFDEGYRAVVDGGGEGTIYEIKQNTAFTASSADGTIFLRDPIVVASDADTQVTLVQNKYVNPVRSEISGGGFGARTLGSFIGVPNVLVPAGDSNTQYFWAQRNGYCPAFVTGTSARRGVSVVISATEPGRFGSVAIDQEGTSGRPGDASRTVVKFNSVGVVGAMVTNSISGEVQLVDLQNSLV